MKIDVATILRIAEQATHAIEAMKKTCSDAREVLARESPKDLPAFDALVIATRKPSQDARDNAARENAEVAKVDDGTGDD